MMWVLFFSPCYRGDIWDTVTLHNLPESVCSRKCRVGISSQVVLGFKNCVICFSLTWLYSSRFNEAVADTISLQRCSWCCQLLTCCCPGICSLLLPLLLTSQWSSSLLLGAYSCSKERHNSFHLETK